MQGPDKIPEAGSHSIEPAWPELFSCEVLTDGERATLLPAGELDLATGPVLEQTLTALREAGFSSILLDLAALTFIDISGVRLVERWCEAAEQDGFGFQLLDASRALRRTFSLVTTHPGLRAELGLGPRRDFT